MLLLSAGACSRPAQETVTLAFLGDVMVGRDVYSRHQDDDWENTLAAIAPALNGADLALGNLESPVCLADSCHAALEGIHVPGEAPEGINLCALPDGISMLGAAGIDLLAAANNHNTDCQEFDTASPDDHSAFWQRNGMALIYAETRPVVMTVQDIRLSFLAFDDISSAINIEEAQALIAAAEEDSDVTIVSVHWGAEYQASPTPRQRAIAAALSEAGADIIWGHHTHVLQAVEQLDRGDGTQTLVMYSLGNALFDQVVPDDTRQSAVLKVTLNRNGVQSVEAVPFLIDPFEGVVSLADPGLADKILQRLHLSEP